MIPIEELADPAVRAFVLAVNTGNRTAFRDALTADATMSDDGTDRDVQSWADREIFSAHGHMTVDQQSPDGLALLARYRNDAWGEMKTRWRFTVSDGRVSRFDTGQA